MQLTLISTLIRNRIYLVDDPVRILLNLLVVLLNHMKNIMIDVLLQKGNNVE
jgi:hypothetical protein